jgi:type VI secretion system protein ImpH
MHPSGPIPALPEHIGSADFIALVALIAAGRPPGAPEPGQLGPFGREVLRFRHSPALAFAGADHLTLTREAHVPHAPSRPALAPSLTLTASFLGLLGVATPLPAHFAAAAAEEDPDDPLLTELCDIFHHRIYALHYRLALRHDLLLALTGAERDTWAARLLGLTGAPSAAPEPALDLSRVLLYRGRRGPRALLLLLRQGLAPWLGDAALGLREATASVLTSRDDQRSALGRRGTTLGRDLHLGATFRVYGAAFAITIHQLDAGHIDAFLPGAPASERLHELVRGHLAESYDYTVELHPRPGQRPTCQLSAHSPRSPLGQTTWLQGQTKPEAPLTLRRPARA